MKQKKKIVIAVVDVCLLIAIIIGTYMIRNKPTGGTVSPTTQPTAKPITTPIAAPTATVVTTATPTKEPEVPLAPEVTLKPEPTEALHVHTWTIKETAPKCTADGMLWEECECGEVVESGAVPKLTPTAVPTETPVLTTPTSTLTPTAIPTPTPKPESDWYIVPANSKQSSLTFTEDEMQSVEVTLRYDDWDKYYADITYTVDERDVVSVTQVADTNTNEVFKIIPSGNGETDVHIILSLKDRNAEKYGESYVPVYTLTIHVTVDMPEPTKSPEPTSAPVPPYNPVENGYTEKIGEWQCGDDIVASLWWNGLEYLDGMASVLVFEGTGEMWSKAKMREAYGISYIPWLSSDFDYGNKVVEMYFSEGITYIGSTSAGGMQLKMITLPSTLKEIGENAFNGASKVTELYLPEGLEVIGKNAFFGWASLTEINIPSTVRSIGWTAFGFHSSNTPENLVVSVTIPDSVEYMDYSVFCNRDDLVLQVEGENYKNFKKGWNYSFDGVELDVIYK